jgi:hypothetical protein
MFKVILCLCIKFDYNKLLSIRFKVTCLDVIFGFEFLDSI